jgi:hypothetical protein
LLNVEKKEENKMVAPLVPLVISGVRIAAPIAAKYLAGKITKKAALKATEKGAKRVKKIQKKNAEKAGKIRDKERNKSVAQEIRELKQTGVGQNMTAKQLKDRVMLNRKDARIPEPKPLGPSKAERAYAKANKAARQKSRDNAEVTTEKGVKVTRFPARDRVEKDPTARPRGYLSPRGKPVGGMKKGGRVGGKCKVDGIAIRGRTRANHK